MRRIFFDSGVAWSHYPVCHLGECTIEKHLGYHLTKVVGNATSLGRKVDQTLRGFQLVVTARSHNLLNTTCQSDVCFRAQEWSGNKKSYQARQTVVLSNLYRSHKGK